jgi:hypothetical protein
MWYECPSRDANRCSECSGLLSYLNDNPYVWNCMRSATYVVMAPITCKTKVVCSEHSADRLTLFCLWRTFGFLY